VSPIITNDPSILGRVFIGFHSFANRKGGHLAVTDANLYLGRVVPKYFPKIFGPNEDEALDTVAVQKVFAKLTEEVNALAADAGTPPKSVDEVMKKFEGKGEGSQAWMAKW